MGISIYRKGGKGRDIKELKETLDLEHITPQL